MNEQISIAVGENGKGHQENHFRSGTETQIEKTVGGQEEEVAKVRKPIKAGGKGNPFTKEQKREIFWTLVKKSDGCWTWIGSLDRNGYGRFKNRPHSDLAHRFAYVDTFGEIPKGMCVLHRCDNPPCVNPFHMFIGTRADNIADCISKGRNSRKAFPGSTNPNAILNEPYVMRIKKMLSEGIRQQQIADTFGVKKGTINNIAQGTTWKHVLLAGKESE